MLFRSHLDVVKTADWIIDLGPEGGERGGQVLVTGTPEEIARHPKSYTGQALREAMKQAKQTLKQGRTQ